VVFTRNLVVLLALAATLSPQSALHPAGAAKPPVVNKMLDLFERLRMCQAVQAKGGRQYLSFQLAESEINEYMRFALRSTPRPGLESVSVKIFPYNYVSTFSVVDFDAVERWRPGTIPGLLRPVLSGKRTIWVDGRFQAKAGQVMFSIEKAYFEKIRLPAILVEKVIQIVAARQPEKYDTRKPLPLPFGLRQVWTEARLVRGEN
jgi:hypothetical protein